MSFDLDDFLARAKRYAKTSGRSHSTVSKMLFSTSRTLPGMLRKQKPVSPRLKTLIEAEKKLALLEGQLVQGAA